MDETHEPLTLRCPPRSLQPIPEPAVYSAPKRRDRGQRYIGVTAHPGDPACWSWTRYSWPRGADEVKQMRLLRGWHDGRCGACGEDGQLVIDHDHRSGWVRGLLCDGCNQKEGRSHELDDVFARWRACPPAAILGLRVVYESGYREVSPSRHRTSEPGRCHYPTGRRSTGSGRRHRGSRSSRETMTRPTP